MDEQRLRDGEVVVVVVGVVGDVVGSSVVGKTFSLTSWLDERRQSVFIPPKYLANALEIAKLTT